MLGNVIFLLHFQQTQDSGKTVLEPHLNYKELHEKGADDDDGRKKMNKTLWKF